ncbi:hypothetical protein Pan241w_15280 [Gimesia alba]|uniref:Uncharacterized protein n=1 Tax=Gimesia alba TaxID=2527973 RepID=A0A517RC45_9PLAN|nr:choice-of-anchor D domain-containing protein [Gimesia alba]QDT41467.1 hypothetical protein Pan241w_15280 [Gimesia alba]
MLLTNWLGTITSRIKKRPTYRSRDRRAIRRRWHAAVNNRISTAEVLEDRTLLTTLFVDDSLVITNDQGAGGLDAGDTVTFAFGEAGETVGLIFGTNAFATINDAVTAAAATGDTIQVAAGTYSGLITLNKSVDLLGANAGIDPNAMARGAESIIDHDGFYAIQPTADDVTIDGFSFEGNGGRVIDSYASANNLTIANNIFNNTNISGVQGGIQLQSGSFDDLTVEQNLFQFTGDGDALLVGGGGSFERMHIVGNHFAGTTGGIFQNGGTINDAVVEQNVFTGGVGMNMGDAGNIQIRENTFDGNFFTGFQVGTIGGEIVGNTFQNIEAYPGFFGQAFELWGGQYGTTVSENVTIENNVIHYNDVVGAAEPTHGIRLRLPDGGSGIDASTIHINNNTFIDGGVRGDAKAIRHFGDQTTAVDASGNWWGTTNESSIAALMEDGDGGTPLMVDFTSFLNDGADTDGGTAGFQGDFSTLNVTTLGAQTGGVGRIQEAIDSVTSGGTVNILAGTYNENVNVNKSVILDGAGTGSTVVDNAGNLFTVTANDVRFQDMTLQNASQGIRAELAAGTVDDLQVDNVHFVNMSSRGIEIHNDTTVTNMSVTNSLFQNTATGIRLASSAVGDGIDITNTEFDGGSLGFYQANDGSTGNVRDLQVTGSTFRNFTDTAIFAEEIRDSAIDGNTFEDNRRDFTLFKNYTGAGTDVENLQIINNMMTDSANSSVLIFVANSGLAGTIDIANNTINSDVGVMTADWAKIDVRLDANFSHAPVNIDENSFTFSGTFGAGAMAAHGIQVRGASDAINIRRNAIDGGNVGSLGGTPPSSGIVVRTNDSSMGQIDAAAVIDVSNNYIINFDNAVTLYDAVGDVFGGLIVGAQLNINNNSLAGNTAGIVSGAGAITNASNNWWGSVVEATVAGLMPHVSSVDFSTYLDNGTDVDGGTTGFQGDFTTLNVTDEGGQTGAPDRIAEALQAVTPGGTVNISSGTYNENVNTTATGIDKNVTLAPGNSPGQAIINGDLILNGDDALEIEINSTTPGSGFDQFVVSGTVDLGGATLNLIDGYDPVDGDVFTLIENTGVGPVTGTFAGLPEGFEFIDFLGSGLSAYLTYVGGNGNDVVIHMVDSTPEVTLPSNGMADEYTFAIVGGNVVITEVGSGTIISSIPLASLNGPLVINGEDGQNDTLTIDMTGIDHTTPLQIEFNGGAAGFDTLELVNGSLTSMEYFFVNNSDGSIQLNGSGVDFITYTGLEPISSTVTATDVTLNFGGTSETITVTDAGGGQTTVNSTAGEMTTFNNPTGTLTINAGGGDDIVNVNSLDPAFAANITINGEGNDDTVNLAAALTLGSGNTTINAEDVNVNGAVTTTGNVDINAGDTIVFALAGSLLSGPGNIDLEAVNNIELGIVGSNADVTLTSTAGAINDANAGAFNISSNGTTTLTAATGVGVGDALETDIFFLEANISGGLELAELDGIVIGNAGGINGITVSGATNIVSGSYMTVNEDIVASGGALQLSNATGSFLISDGAVISNTGSNLIEIDSGFHFSMADNGTQITSSGSGLIDIDAAGHVSLTNVNTSGEVQITTTGGEIYDNTAAESPVITADTVALRATSHIGLAGAGDLDLAINIMAAESTAGDIFLQEPSAASIGLVDGLSGITAAGDISLVIGGTLNVNHDIEATGAGSTILADAQGDINVSASVQTNGGAIDLLADNNLVINAFSSIDTTSAATVTLTADADSMGGGQFQQDEISIVDAFGGMIDVTSTGDALIAALQSAGGTIAIESVSGAIQDNTAADLSLVTSNELVLRAATGIGGAGAADFDIAVSRLAASTTTGDMILANASGALEIGTVDGLSGVTVTTGLARLVSFGAITVNQSVTGDGVSFEVAGSAAVGDDLNVNAGITSTGGDIDLLAGDDLNLATGVTLNSAAAIDITLDINSGVDAEGGVANLNGILTAGTQITVTGDDDDDQVIIDGNGGVLNNGGTVDGIQSIFSFVGGNGTDELIVDDSGDATGDIINIVSLLPGIGSVVGAGANSLSFEALENLRLFTGSDMDDITVNPNVLTTIDIFGGTPSLPAFPGDSLTYLTPMGETSTFTPSGPDSGTIAATGGFQNVTFDEIESLTFGGSISVDGTAGDDVLTITATGADSGTYQINGGSVINFSAVTDFTFNGLTGDDRLVINNPAGGLFDPVDGITFNGGSGGETLGDTLEIIGGTAGSVEHRFVNDNDGSVFYNGEGFATITYTGLEPVLDTIAATDRIFSFTGAGEMISLTDGGIGGQSQIDSTLGESVVFTHPTGTLTINTEASGGSGVDTVNLDGADAAFTANLTVNAGTDDIINTGTVDIGAGMLDLTAGQVNVNGAFTTTGSVDIDSTFNDITFAAAGSIDAGASDIDLTAFFNVESLQVTTTSEVRVTATGGGINDFTGNALITADRAALRVGGPGGITGIDTNVNTLATSVAGGGFTIDNTGALEIGTVDGLSGITAAASSIFLTTTGTLLVSEAVTGGAVDLRSNDTMTISNDIAASTGTLELENTGGGFLVNNSAVISNTGSNLIDIDSASDLTMVDGTEITSSGNGLIDLDASLQISLTNVNTGGEVQITSALSYIGDNSIAEDAVITADTVALRAATVIGAAGAGDIDLAINTMAAVTTSGDIFIQEPSAATVGIVDGLIGMTAPGHIFLAIGGTLNINSAIEATGAASIVQANVQGDINVNNTVQTNGGEINLFADDNLVLGASSLVDTTTAELVRLIADFNSDSSGGFTQDEGSLVNARGGDLLAQAFGDVEIADLQSVGGRVVVISNGGGVVDNTTSPSEAPLITASGVAFQAAGSVGGAGDADIDTAVSTLSANVTSGDVVVSNTGALIIGDVIPLSGVVATNGSVTVSASSPLTVASNVTASGTVTLTSTDGAGPGDDLTINAGVTVESTGADVILNSGDNFLLALTGEVIADTTITINVDPITDGAGATVDLLGNVDATLTTINGGDDEDTFNILPTQDSPITINGGNPTLPTVPGDVLNLDFTGLTSPVLTLGMSPGSGTFSFAGDPQLPVTYSSIENVTTSTGAYHLVLDMLASGFQNAAADTIDAALDGSGTDLVIDINAANFFTGDASDILSFTVIGSADNDTLNINESPGGLPFFTTAAPAIGISNGSHLNAAADFFLEDIFNPNTYDATDITIHFDGGAGVDDVNVDFITDHDAGYFSDMDDALGSGNIVAALTGDTDIDLGLSFARVEGAGIFGTTTGGGLHVDASATPATSQVVIDDALGAGDGISQVMANGGFTNLLFGGFNDLQLVSGPGSETIDLIALDSITSLTNIELDADDVFGTNAADNDVIRVHSAPLGVLNIDILAAAGDDVINVFDAGNTVDNINAQIMIDGEGGDDTLILIDSGDLTGDTFEVTSTTVEGLTSAVGTDITYMAIDNLNVTGTDGNDDISVNLTTQEDLNNVTINGFNGDDDFSLQNGSTPMGVDTRLNGDAGNDEFFFLPGSILRGFIDGGGDVDTIDYTTYAAVVHIALSGLGTIDGFQGRENNGSILGTGIGSLGFDNIDDLLGTAGGDTLEGPDLNNYWGITSTDTGFIIADRPNLMSGRPTTGGDATATPPEQFLSFLDFENLIGGNLDDRFDLSDGAGLTGTLNGDLGNDSLDYRDYTTGVNVDLFAGTATNIGGGLALGTGGGDDDNSIENVFGGDGNDNITGDNDDNILGDGFGNDNLDGGGNGVGSENGGNDVFLMEPGAGGSADVITDIHGNDTIDFRFASQGIVFDADIINMPQDVFGGNTVELRQIQPQQPDTNPSFMENVVGSEFNDLIFIDPLSQDGNFPIDGPPVLRSADGRGGLDTLDFDAKGQSVIDTGFSLTADGVGTVQYLNFENVRPFEDSPGFIVDNGDVGFTLTGDWAFHPNGTAAITNGTGFEDDIHSVHGNTPTGTGPAQAFWEFFGLTPGEYRVSVTWPVSDNPQSVGLVATDTPFTVFDGAQSDVGTIAATPLATVDLNQQLLPDDFSADGAIWEDLGTFTISTRSLTVMLTNLADGNVIADAIRIERVSAGPEIELTDVTDVLAPPAVVVDGHPGGIQFGDTELLTPAVRTFEITNNGSAVLNISNITIPAGYTTDLTPQAVGIGATIQFTITMDASSFGDRSGIFSFETDDVDEATFNILLDGRVSNVVIIDDGDAEFSATAGFQNFPDGTNLGDDGYQADSTAAIPNQPGATTQPGAETATWTFTDLADGNYRVSTTWAPYFNRVDDAPFSLDGGSGVVTVDVNQQVTPSSFTEDGTAWFDLNASYLVVGGVLTVTLTNDANNNPRDFYHMSDLSYGVIADAIRIEYLPEPDLQVTVDMGTVVEDDTGNVDFGSTLPGVPVSKTFTVTNLSSMDVDVTGLVEFPAGFSIDPASPFGTDTMPVTIAGGGSVTFTIQFDGGTSGSTFGQISFTTGDEDENPYNFTVSGTAGPATVGITDSDFSTTGTWNDYTPRGIGDPEFLYAGVADVGGSGANSATWSFDVEPGRYQVVANWYVHPNLAPYGGAAASNAPYTIYDDLSPVTTVLVSHQTNPNDFLDDGTLWEYIGNPVAITGNTLSVQLTDNADGIVFADEIRIYRVVDPVISVEVDGGVVEDGGTVDFEETIVGAPVIKTFTVTNYGERNMALGTLNLPAGFSLLSGFGNDNLSPGSSTTFTVQMDAAVAGPFGGMISFGADSFDANPFNFSVTGSAQNSMIVDNGDLNYSNSGPWETVSINYDSSFYTYFQRDQDILRGGDLLGSNTATWTFDNLGAGTYQVSTHWFQHSSLAPDAQITISGIEGGPITVSLDQRYAPNDFTADGTTWEELGNFQVAAGATLTVTITDDGANGDVVADAMRLELIPIGLRSPEIEVQADAVDLVSGVGSVDLGTASFAESLFQTFTITNSGTDTLNLGAISTPANFSVFSGPGTVALAAGQSTTFVLEFNSTGMSGVSAGVVSIANDDTDENPFTINVSATMTTVQIVDNGDADYSSVGPWQAKGGASLFYYESDAQQLNLGDNGTATWNFNGLAAGTYTVSTTWYQHSSLRASNAEYNIGTGPIVVNQRLKADDFYSEGKYWEILGTIAVGAGGTITVTLSDNVADGSIIADAVRIERTGPLVAAAGVSSTPADSITQADLDAVRNAALTYWSATGLTAEELDRLQSVSFVLADLPDAMLGGANSSTILIDVNAAGYGWFVDDSPFDNSEFTLDADGNLVADEASAAFGRMDLLTVVMHELGHVLGYDDLDADEAGNDLMSESLNDSQRRLPVIDDADASDLDDFFSAIAGGDNPLLN